ncbi:hypothetical protein IRJ41_006696 [Triplophysa rosa]|uniref:Uncharacterized protein n=1 Tax=Triplophysa rosa TaxID=992332 RepID=A0A9W7TQJ5_TRIRA|nr:hypothetical protein IRJ41_006696 [Triplophysa rosa]
MVKDSEIRLCWAKALLLRYQRTPKGPTYDIYRHTADLRDLFACWLEPWDCIWIVVSQDSSLLSRGEE